MTDLKNIIIYYYIMKKALLLIILFITTVYFMYCNIESFSNDDNNVRDELRKMSIDVITPFSLKNGTLK